MSRLLSLFPRSLLPFAALPLLLAYGCGTSPGQIGGDGDGGGDDDDIDVDAGPGPGSDGSIGPDADMTDAPMVCIPTGNEVFGDGLDNDCDEIVDEVMVCADGSESFTTIGAAIAAAPDGGGIEVCAGVYNERLTITRSLRINGAGVGSTTVDAGDLGQAFVVEGGHDLTLSGMTIRRGHSTNEGGAIRCISSKLTVLASAVVDSRSEVGGGGIFAASCDLKIDGTRFTNNEGSDRGGALLAANSTGVIFNADFNDNSADYGGAVHLLDGGVNIKSSRFTMNGSRVRGGALYQASDSAVENSMFNQNHSGWTGGAVHVNQHAPTFRTTQFTNNRSEWEGGAFYLHQAQAVLLDNIISGNWALDDGGGLRIFESAARLERNVISNNRSDDGDGGAFKISHVAGTFIDNMLIDNWALGAGGGAEFDNDSSVWRGGVVSGNHASIGGGMHVMLWPWNGGLIEDVRITGNDAHRGGGMYIENSYQLVTVRRVTVTGNEANYGGGIYTRGSPLRLSNSIIAGNQAHINGGGFFVHASNTYPWTHECPCPAVDPVAEVAFVVVDGNIADTGTAVWVNAPGITFRDSIFSGHTGEAVTVAEMPVPPPMGSPPGTPTTMQQAPPPGWSYNDTMPATFGGMSDPSGGNGNISRSPNFVAPASFDFHLAPGSACIDAAQPAMTDHDGSRADQGFFGGPNAP